MKDRHINFSYLILFISISLTFGCQVQSDAEGQTPMQSVATQIESAEVVRDSVLVTIESVNTDPFMDAFENLKQYDYTRYIRTEQFDDNDFMVAFTERSVRYEGISPQRRFTVLSSDSSGAYDFGYFRRFVSENVDEQDPEDLTPFLFPEKPSYLSSRNFEAYSYAFEEDSLMLNITAQVLEINALPEEGDGKNIRKARYFIDPDTNELIAFQLERIDLAVFFREESNFFMHIQKTQEGEFVPYNTRFETRIIVPFRDPQRFRTVASYVQLNKQ